MTRVVELTFDGNSRGAVGAARETVAAVDKVKAAAVSQAQAGITKRLEERQSLQALAAEYTRVATTAKRGSEQQIAALKLEQQALRRLSDEHAVQSRRLQSSTHELERFTKGAVIGSGALGHLGRTAAIASGSFLTGVGVIEVFKRATSEGSLLSTQVERTTKVFGAQAGVIKAWSKDSVAALGLAKSETLDYANSIGQLLVNMRLAPAAAAAMSKGLLQRAADVATEKNVPTGDVVGAFTAALNGQTRGLREYGIALDSAMVKAEAERLGLVKNTVDLGKVADATQKVRIAKYELGVQEQKHGVQSAEAAKATLAVDSAERALAKTQAGHAETLTKAQRAQATYNAILDQTGKTAGYIAGHTNDLTVQQRKLHAEITTLYEQMGAGLIPMLLKYLPHLTAWIDKNEKNGTFQRDFNSAIKLGGEVIGAVVPIVKEIAKVWGHFSDAVGGSKTALEILAGVMVGAKLLGGFKLLEAAAGEKGAAGAIGLLRKRLLLLGKMGVITVGIELVINRQSIQDYLSKKLGWVGKTAGASLFMYDTLWKEAQAAAGVGGSGSGLQKGLAGASGKQANIVAVAQTVQKDPSMNQYVYGGGGASGPSDSSARHDSYHFKGFDCSSFVQYVMAQNGITVPRTSQAQAAGGIAVPNGQLAPGDIVFTDGWPHPGHVGIYIGDGKVIHDPHTGAKITTSTLKEFGWNGHAVRYWKDKNTSGMSNDPVHDAGGGNTTPTAATPTTTSSNDTSTGGTFIEKVKPKKVVDVFKAIRTALKTGIVQINDDVDKGLFPADVGARLEARATAIQKSLAGATKADIPKIRTQMKDLNAAVSSALRATRDQALLGKDIGQVRTDVKDGLLSKSVGDSLVAQAKAINARLVKDIFDPKKSAADDAAARGFRARIAAMLSQAAEVRTIDSDLSKAALANTQALEQALGIPVEHATEGAVAKAKAGIAKIRAEFASNKVIPAAEQTKLKQQLATYQATVADGMQGVIDAVSSKRTTFETAWGRLSSAAFSAFDKETSRHLTKMQDDAKRAIDAIEVTVQGSGFASFLFGGAGAQTPTEKLLAQRQAAKQKADDIQSITDATKNLADAQAALAAGQASGGTPGTAGTSGVAGHDAITNAAGDSVIGIGVDGLAGTPGTPADLASLQQAVVDAQKALDDAKYQQESDDLSVQAQLERDAADKQLSAAQDAAQKLADQQAQDYQDQRDSQRQHIQDLFDAELEGILTGKKTLADAMTELGGMLGMNLAQAFATWFDPANPASVTSTLAGFLYQVEMAKGKTSSQAAVAALSSLPPSSSLFAPVGVDFTTGFNSDGIPIAPAGGWTGSGQGSSASGNWRGFAGGGWADQGRPVVDPRDTIPAMLSRGEYVMSRDEVQAGGPSWASGGGQTVGDVYLDGKKVGIHVAPHVTNAQERQIGYPSSRG